jgi:hypothetical protein
MRNTLWPTGLCVSEGVANARAGRWVSLIVVLAVAWITAAVGLANALEVSALARAEQEWIAAGAFVMSVEPASSEPDSGIDVVLCERLSHLDGISASFAVRATTATIEPANAPGTLTTLTEVSPGAFAFLDAHEPVGVGVLATATAAGATGLADGEHTTFKRAAPLSVSSSFEGTAVIVDRSDLSPGLEGSFLLPTLLSGRADSCFIKSDAAHYSAVATYVGEALSAPDGSLAIVRPLLSKNTYGVDFATAYSTRVLRWGWLAGAAALAAMWALVQRTRRTRNAIYQTFGAHSRARLAMQTTEWAFLSFLGVAWGWGAALTFAIGFGADPRISLTQITLQTIATWGAASIAVIVMALIPVGDLLDALKDRS